MCIVSFTAIALPDPLLQARVLLGAAVAAVELRATPYALRDIIAPTHATLTLALLARKSYRKLGTVTRYISWAACRYCPVGSTSSAHTCPQGTYCPPMSSSIGSCPAGR